MIIAPGEKVFGALLAIAGAGIILTGHWATTDDMIADLIGSADGGVWRCGLIDVELSALTAALVGRGDGRLLHRARRQRGRPRAKGIAPRRLPTALGNNEAGRFVSSFIQESLPGDEQTAARYERKRSQLKTKTMGHKHWTKRSRETGTFTDQKKAGNSSRFAGKRATDRVPGSNPFLDYTSMMLPVITFGKSELRSTPEQYRALARECMKWADSAKTIEQREILLDMATHWAEAAARLDHQHALIGQFGELMSKAKANPRAVSKVLAAHGSGLSKHTNGSGQPKQPEAASHAKYHQQREHLAREWRNLAWQAELDREHEEE